MTIHSGTPPGSDRVCDHNTMSAFPQEKISHYTTGNNNETKTPQVTTLAMNSQNSIPTSASNKNFTTCLFLF